MSGRVCPDCGSRNDRGARFCQGCGRALAAGLEAAVAGEAVDAVAAAPLPSTSGERRERPLWRGRPSLLLAPRLHLTTRYRLSDERLIIEHGLFGRWTEEIDLYRVTDVAVAQRFLARLLGHGDVRLLTTDRTAPEKRLLDVPAPDRLKDLVREAARAERERRRVLLRNEV